MRIFVHTKNLRGWGVVIGIPALFVLAYFYVSVPVLGTMGMCAVRHFLKFPCPGCGLTTSFINLSHGNIRLGIDAHPLGIIVAGWLIYQFGRAVCGAVLKRRPKELLTQTGRDIILWAFLAALILQWIAKLMIYAYFS